MPFDQKRINGPESFSYKQFVVRDGEAKSGAVKGHRADGRQMDEHRKFGEKSKLFFAHKLTFLLAIQLDVISKAKGSCYIENGNTKIICAVFELREVPRVNKYA